MRSAIESGKPCAPIRDKFEAGDVDSAYEIQKINVDLGVRAGRRIAGYKIGLTAPAVQRQLGVDQPDFGTLFADRIYASGVEIPTTSLISPRIEAEVALVLDKPLDLERHSVLDVIGATAYAVPALEIVDSRIAGWDIGIIDSIADNASAGAIVLGSRPLSLAEFDISALAMKLTKNGEVVSAGQAADCLGNPLNAVIWLANTLSALGRPLGAGHVVMTGALGPMVPVTAGDSYVGDFGVLGSVTTRFSN